MELPLVQNQYVICVATPCSAKEFINTPFGKTMDRLPSDITIDIVCNNKRGLSEVYNECIMQWKDSKIIFVHDDVEIHDLFFKDKLDKAFMLFDIVGLAGGREANFSKYNDYEQQTLMWHLMAPRDKLSGFVSHYFGNNIWNSSYFGPTPARTITIDGLFISVDAAKCIENGAYFDEEYKFHYYDLAFSINAHNKGLKVGTYPIFVVHHGLGYVDDMKGFLEDQHKFNTNYAPK